MVARKMEKEKADEKLCKNDDSDMQISFGAMNDEIILDRLRKTNADEFSGEEAKQFLKELCDSL